MPLKASIGIETWEVSDANLNYADRIFVGQLDMNKPIILQSKLDLPAAGPLAKSILDLEEGNVVLDAQEVSQIGALCVQVMLSAATSANKSGHALSIINANDRVLEQLSYFGLTPESIAEGKA